MEPDPGSCSQAVRPQAISDLVLAAERMRFPTDSKQMQAKPGSCTRCSYISSQPVCKVRSPSCEWGARGLNRHDLADPWCCRVVLQHGPCRLVARLGRSWIRGMADLIQGRG